MYYLFALFCILSMVYLVNKWVIKPKKMISHFEKAFREKGYKLKVYPYSPLGAPQLI